MTRQSELPAIRLITDGGAVQSRRPESAIDQLTFHVSESRIFAPSGGRPQCPKAVGAPWHGDQQTYCPPAGNDAVPTAKDDLVE